MKNIIHFGAGQNSTAMIIEVYNRGIKIDEVIFADTKAEMPETYSFLEEFKKWLSERKIKFTIVYSKLGSLYDYYYSKKVTPSRLYRHCTDKFKIVPINKYLKTKYKKAEILNFFGISIEESKRADKIKLRNNNTKFPLIEWSIDRNKCIEIIKKEGLPIPVKSGCYVCPFQSVKVWRELLIKHPDLFNKAKELEEHSRSYPKYPLNPKPLKDIYKWREQKVLATKDNPCIYCEVLK